MGMSVPGVRAPRGRRARLFAGVGVMMAIRFGIARGVFSNEAGLGSAPMAHATAQTDHPARQGMWGIFEVFFARFGLQPSVAERRPPIGQNPKPMVAVIYMVISDAFQIFQQV